MRNAKTVNCSIAHGIISNAMILEAAFAGLRDFPGGFWWFIIFGGLSFLMVYHFWWFIIFLIVCFFILRDFLVQERRGYRPAAAAAPASDRGKKGKSCLEQKKGNVSSKCEHSPQCRKVQVCSIFCYHRHSS